MRPHHGQTQARTRQSPCSSRVCAADPSSGPGPDRIREALSAATHGRARPLATAALIGALLWPIPPVQAASAGSAEPIAPPVLNLTPSRQSLRDQPPLPSEFGPSSRPSDGYEGEASLPDVIRTALARYPAIVVARANRESAHYDVAQAQAGHFPSVSVNGQRRVVGPATNLAQPTLNLNLYASGAIEANVERQQWREQALASTVSATREDVAFEAAQAWFRLLRGVAIQSANLRNLERHGNLVSDFAAIASIDTGRRYDLIQARSRMEQVRQTATVGQAEIVTARAALLRYYPKAFDLGQLRMPPILPEPALPGEQELAVHPNVESARRSLMSAEANVRATRAARGPRVDLAASAGAYSSTVVQFSWPAFDLARSAAEDSAGAGLVGARASLEEQELLVRERLATSYQAFGSAAQRQDVAESQIKASSELVEVYRAQFQIGRRNLLDLLNAYAELFNAESSREAARVDRALYRYQLEYAAGRLAARFEAPPSTASAPPAGLPPQPTGTP